MTTENTNTPVVTFESILSANGMTAEHKPRLTVAPNVVKSLADTNIANVVVLGIEAFDGTNDSFVTSIKSAPHTSVIEVRDSEATRLRAHVASFAKSRKVALTIVPLKSAEGLIGYVFRSAK